MLDLVASQQQRQFGLDKRDTLPQYCLECDVRFACHGGCPKDRFISTPDGEPGLNYLCAGLQGLLPPRRRADALHGRAAPCAAAPPPRSCSSTRPRTRSAAATIRAPVGADASGSSATEHRRARGLPLRPEGSRDHRRRTRLRRDVPLEGACGSPLASSLDGRARRAGSRPRRATAGRVPPRPVAVPRSDSGSAARARAPGQRPDPRLPAAYGTSRRPRRADGRRARAAVRDGVRGGGRRSRPSTACTHCSCRRCCTRCSDRRGSSSSGPRGRSRRSSARPCSRSPWRGAARRRSSRRCSRCSSARASCSPGSSGSAGSPTTSPGRCSIGYIHGVAVVLVCGQLGKLLGTRHRRDAADRAGRRGAPGARRRERDDR